MSELALHCRELGVRLEQRAFERFVSLQMLLKVVTGSDRDEDTNPKFAAL